LKHRVIETIEALGWCSSNMLRALHTRPHHLHRCFRSRGMGRDTSAMMLSSARLFCSAVVIAIAPWVSTPPVHERCMLWGSKSGREMPMGCRVHMSGCTGLYSCRDVHSWQPKYAMFLMFSSLPSTLTHSTVSSELQFAQVSLEVDVCILSFDIFNIDFVLTARTHLIQMCFSHIEVMGNS